VNIDKRIIKRRLIAGLVVIAPVTVTALVLWWIFQALDRFLYPLLALIIPGDWVPPGLGLVALVILLITIGWAAERAIGSRIVSWWHNLLEKIPVTRRIYGAANRIVRTVFGKDGRPFKQVVLIEYPSDGRWAVGFLAAPAPAVVREHVADSVSVFVPTTPNPTSGWLVIVPRSRVTLLSMTIDEAFTYILSAGAATDDWDLPAIMVSASSVAPATASPAQSDS
jgi:uncharacterized membrane protein